jgi:hypothetical protein
MVSDRENRLTEGYLYEGKIDRDTFEQQRTRLRGEREALLRKLGRNRSTAELAVHDVLDFASGLLQDLVGCWNRLKSLQRQAFLRGPFPEGMTYDGDSFGTAQTPWIFSEILGRGRSNEALVAPTGFEPVLPP